MEPMEINGGRFYVRPLHDDDRIDDRPALAEALNTTEDAVATFVATARDDWHANRRLTWAVAEQTNVDMLALAELVLPPDFVAPEERTANTPPPTTPATVRTISVGDPARVLPNDPVLTRKTVGDATEEGLGTVRRWAEGYLGVRVVDAEA
ncbi:hypothetical protein C1Y63_06415 [Corynebacterium sp. 13CS0277]|uniref:hypothetical protein n=1 Tax=Corynebacterium sp. 13CS0277 TaxID=2071994 RepID=UPI000D02DE81|nr:hypothetical protein [Corynebacterium sp. 13CS0277]PRQ11340.1 hypothetical protein C1Y63_06415 [Corynebacterium sp. 13CS0277]